MKNLFKRKPAPVAPAEPETQSHSYRVAHLLGVRDGLKQAALLVEPVSDSHSRILMRIEQINADIDQVES